MAYNQKLRGGGPSSTAWSKQKSRSGGFYASDTIISRQHHPQPSQKPSGRNAKAKVVKSKEIIQLEELIDTLERGIPENVGGPHGCFCLAQVHDISSYTPICPHCGLILCIFQAPASPCPHCFSPLLSTNERSQLIARLQSDIADVLRKEEQKREEERLEQARLEVVRAGGGAFPTLGHVMASTGNRGIPSTPSSSNTHKVLSLNSKTKKVTVSSYKPAQQQPTPPSTTPTPEDQAEREKLEPIPPPPSEIEHAKGKPPANRPFFNLRAPLPLTYISAKGKETSKESQRGGNKRKNERRRSSTLSKPQNVRPGAPSSQEQTSST